MKVLIVDDDEAKLDEIRSLILSLHGKIPDTILVAGTLPDAIRQTSIQAFDLVVLDLMLPYLAQGAADRNTGYELLKQLRTEGSLNRHTPVIAISAFPEEIDSLRSEFEKLGVLIIKFDEHGGWKKTLTSVFEDVSKKTTAAVDLDFLIVCALDSERAGYAATKIILVADDIVQGLNISFVQTESGLKGGILRLSSIGLVTATREVTLALQIFRVRAICMSGICAGFDGQVGLGQLVAASPVWEYQAGKWSENDFEIAPEQVPLRPATRVTLDKAFGSEAFLQSLEDRLRSTIIRPARLLPPILAPFATGSAVIADSKRLVHIAKQHRKIAALDMETFGLYSAAYFAPRAVEHFFSIKCVVDLGNNAKNDQFHEYGCATSARAVEYLLALLLNGNAR